LKKRPERFRPGRSTKDSKTKAKKVIHAEKIKHKVGKQTEGVSRVGAFGPAPSKAEEKGDVYAGKESLVFTNARERIGADLKPNSGEKIGKSA